MIDYASQVRQAISDRLGEPWPAAGNGHIDDTPRREDSSGYGSTQLTATVRTLADVTPERVAWLWPGRLPLGKLVVLDGDPSVGKSTLGLDLAARVSTGSTWPDGAAGTQPAGVLILSAEDGLADTIAPRLTAAGADMTRVHALLDVPITAEDGSVQKVPPSLPRDIATIERTVVEHGVKLVIVDVLMAYLSGKVDSHRDQDVRGVLHQLAAFTEKTGCTMVLVRHLNKTAGANALYRGGGSIGIVGAARAGYLVARDPDDQQRRILAVTKSNLAADPPSLAYRLVNDPINYCARIEWEDGTNEHTAATLLRGTVDDDERDERNEIDRWLLDYLTDCGGSAAAQDVIKAARAAGYTEDTVKKARARIKVESTRIGFGKGASYSWGLPHGSRMDAMESSTQDPASMASMEDSMDANLNMRGTHISQPQTETVERRVPTQVEGRTCPECGKPVRAGVVRHPECFQASMKKQP